MGARALLLEAVRSEGFNPRSQRIVLQRLKPLLHRLRPGPRALLLEAVWSEGFNPRSQLIVLQRLKPLLHRLRNETPRSPPRGRVERGFQPSQPTHRPATVKTVAPYRLTRPRDHAALQTFK